MKVNLHIHSIYSDGTQWPEEIIKRASKLNLTHVALTDHDSMGGVPDFIQAAREAGIKAMAGVEIDCEASEISYNSEILGYFPAGQWSHTREFCLDRIRHRGKQDPGTPSQSTGKARAACGRLPTLPMSDLTCPAENL